MPKRFPQYAASHDPEVIAAVEAAEKSWQKLVDYAASVSMELTGEDDKAVCRGSVVTGAQVVGINVATRAEYNDLPGQWRKRQGPGFQYPFKNNPLMIAWRKNAHPRPTIPGRPQMAFGHGYMGAGSVFVHDGVAYSGFDFFPAETKGSDLWPEVKAGVFHTAMAAYNEARAARKQVAS